MVVYLNRIIEAVLKSTQNQHLSRVMRKPVFRVSDQILHKPGFTATENGYRLEISYLEGRGIVLSM